MFHLKMLPAVLGVMIGFGGLTLQFSGSWLLASVVVVVALTPVVTGYRIGLLPKPQQKN